MFWVYSAIYSSKVLQETAQHVYISCVWNIRYTKVLWIEPQAVLHTAYRSWGWELGYAVPCRQVAASWPSRRVCWSRPEESEARSAPLWARAAARSAAARGAHLLVRKQHRRKLVRLIRSYDYSLESQEWLTCGLPSSLPLDLQIGVAELAIDVLLAHVDRAFPSGAEFVQVELVIRVEGLIVRRAAGCEHTAGVHLEHLLQHDRQPTRSQAHRRAARRAHDQSRITQILPDINSKFISTTVLMKRVRHKLRRYDTWGRWVGRFEARFGATGRDAAGRCRRRRPPTSPRVSTGCRPASSRPARWARARPPRAAASATLRSSAPRCPSSGAPPARSLSAYCSQDRRASTATASPLLADATGIEFESSDLTPAAAEIGFIIFQFVVTSVPEAKQVKGEPGVSDAARLPQTSTASDPSARYSRNSSVTQDTCSSCPPLSKQSTFRWTSTCARHTASGTTVSVFAFQRRYWQNTKFDSDGGRSFASTIRTYKTVNRIKRDSIAIIDNWQLTSN